MHRVSTLVSLICAAVVVTAFFFVLPPPIVTASSRIDFPSPLSGPGVEDLKKSQTKKIGRAWREFTEGDIAESKKRLARAGENSPARLLGYQLRLAQGDVETVEELAAFCDQHSEYAAAWMTLSVAAERGDSELIALNAARHGSQLWTTPPWGDRAAELEQRWTNDRVVQAIELFDAGDTDSALAELEAVKILDPDRRDVALLEAKILFADDQLEPAIELLKGLTDEPDAIFILGQIAEKRGRWQSAMESYSSLPMDHPGRSQGLQRAQTRWRMNLLPGYARASMRAEPLSRSDLAIVLVSIQPQLETLPGGEVPVMSDIVDHPGQREIITAVRLGIINTDRRERLFFPDRQVDMETVRNAVQRSRALLGLSSVVWCIAGDVIGSGCTSMPSPPNGGAVVNAVLDPTSGAMHE